MLEVEKVRRFKNHRAKRRLYMSNKSTEYKNKFNAEKYDSLRIVVPKGKKSVIESVARSQGDSINGYVKKAVKGQIKNDTGQDVEL